MRSPALAVALAGACLLWLLAPPASAAEPTPIPGTNVRLVVPEGFAVSSDFPGLGRDDDLTSVLVTQLPVSVEVSRQSFDAEGLGQRGVEVHRIVEVPVAGREGWLAHATQTASGIAFRKWILLFGDETQSVLITATTPLDLEAVHQEALVETLAGAEWSPGPVANPEAGLPFRVAEVPPLRVVSSVANALVLSDPSHTPGRVAPLVAVGASLAQVQIADLAAFARRRLEQTVSIDEIEIDGEGPRSLDGMPAHAIHARARDEASERAVVVTQVLATDGARYYIVQGIADAESEEGFQTVFERLIESFRRTP